MEPRFIFSTYFVYLIQFCLIVQGNEFVTLWAPKTILKDQPYCAIVMPTKLQGKTEVALQFRNFNLTKKLDSGHAVRIEYPGNLKGSRKEANLIMTLHVDEPIDRHNVIRICSTKSLKIKYDYRVYHTFIQTDKPIYKPGDEVKFKVLVIDRNIRPYHMNNIDVDIIDPLNRSIAHFDDLEDANLGVFEGSFMLGTQTVLGDWTIQVKVDRSRKMMKLKNFTVQKYIFPLFDVFVNISDQHVLASSRVTISFYAKYPFGEFVTGNAELKIFGVKNRKSYLKNRFVSIDGVQKSTYKLQSDLNITKEEIELEALVTFTEPKSGLSYNKSARFFVHTDTRHKMVVKHPEKFIPGQLFTVKILINNWKDQRIAINSKTVKLTAELKISDIWNQTFINLDIVDGIASHDIIIPKEGIGLKIKIEFLDSEKYEKSIEMGNVKVGINDLEVYHLPKYPKLNQTIDVFIKSVRNLDNVLAVAMTRYGPVKSGKINCKNQKVCKFNVTINEKLMPQSTIFVYHLKDYVNIFLGKTEVETENLGANYLNLKLSTDTAKPKEQLKMSFSTKTYSKIHLLAFDKRLRFLKEGNEITRIDVAKTLADYDGDNFLLIDDMTTWHKCTKEELNRVDKGRKAMNDIVAAANIFALKGKKQKDEYDDEEDLGDESIDIGTDYNEFEDHFNDDDDKIDEPELDEEEIRKNFPESWIFETFEVGNSEEAVKSFTVPDSITSWDISAFSINKNDGLAIMKPQELKVKDEFFIKVNLPYSIRYKEVLKLDVLIHNYIESYEELEVSVDLKENTNFQIVKYSSNCTLIIDQNYTRTVSVQPMEAKKVSFYIQAGSADPNANINNIKLEITAKGRTEGGISYQDTLQEELRVDPIGLRMYHVSTNKFYLDAHSSTPRVFTYSGSSEYERYSAIVGGNFLSDAGNFESMIEIFSSSLEDKALKLKESYDAYRFLNSKGQKMSSNLVNQYQKIMSLLSNEWVKPSIPFRIVFVDALASLMKIRLLSTNQAQIQEHFDAIERDFLDNIGSKSASWFQEEFESENFKVAFALIPLIKHKDILTSLFIQRRSSKYFFNLKNYDGTIEKGMNYLKNNEAVVKSDNIVLSITAYVHALYGNNQVAQKFLTELEKFKLELKTTQKCYKLNASDTVCDNLVTAYTALTYMKLNKAQEAITIFNFLVESNPLNKFTTEHAVVTEAIAEIGINLKDSPTNLKVKLENNLGFQTFVQMKSDSTPSQIIDFPEYTRNISTTVTGNGFCTVSIISETTLTIPKRNTKFNVIIETENVHRSEKIVKVCATYNPNESDFYYINDVFYEIEVPSGYVYTEYIKEDEQNIMEVQERQKGTVLSVHFHEFEKQKQYCIKIKMMKIFTVKETKDSAVRVYDYSDKYNNEIQFYSFLNQECESIL